MVEISSDVEFILDSTAIGWSVKLIHRNFTIALSNRIASPKCISLDLVDYIWVLLIVLILVIRLNIWVCVFFGLTFLNVIELYSAEVFTAFRYLIVVYAYLLSAYLLSCTDAYLDLPSVRHSNYALWPRVQQKASYCFKISKFRF